MEVDQLEVIIPLVQQLNPDKPTSEIEVLVKKMFTFDNYSCFGFYDDGELVGLTSGWTTVKIYSGKQLEVDNVIVDSKLQSKGYGKIYFDLIEKWAGKKDYKTIELNPYPQNRRSHKFYFNQGYSILGYHFQKTINN